MPLYIFIFHFDDEDAAVYRSELEFDNDAEALDAAENLAHHYKIDVWQGEKLVAQVKHERQNLQRHPPAPV